MTGATLCSGIGCPEVSAPWIDWKFCAETAGFPSRVLKARFPHVPNLGDLTAPDFTSRAIAALDGATLDVLVFGAPCQSFSVAGNRLGLNDPRGNLALVCLGVVRDLRPRWFVFENVPGLLSSWSGGKVRRPGLGRFGRKPTQKTERNDFAAFLQAVAQCGYAGGWASPDAQWFGVAQRRKRVFFVGHAGDWRGPAGVLSEFHRLRGNTPARAGKREDGEVAKDIAPCLRGNGPGVGRIGDSRSDDCIVSHALSRNSQYDFETETFVTHSLRGEGHDASEDGTGRGVPIVAVNLRGREGGAMPETSDVVSVRAASGGSSRSFVCFDPNQITSGANRSNPQPGEPVHTLPAAANSPIVIPILEPGSRTGRSTDDTSIGSGIGEPGAPSFTLSPRPHGIAFTCKDYGADAGETAPTLRAMGHADSHANAGGQVAATTASGLRRLTPIETERLQGLPDNWTAVNKFKRKILPEMARYLMRHGLECWETNGQWFTCVAADGPRYKAVGNGMAVPVIGHLLRSIEKMESVL